MKILDRYIDQLLEKSSPSRPIWNIEKIRQGAKPSWNYMDGCMINAILELYHITQKEEYLDFADRVALLHDGHVLAEGATKEVITPERIEKAYGIRAAIHNLEDRWIVLPEKSL